MKNILIALIVFIPFSSALSQTWQIGIGSGKLIYSQKTLKAFNEGISILLPFETAITDDFPATPFFRGEAGYNFKKFLLGVNYTYNSTGSRLTSSDYSGNYYFDVILTGHITGISCGYYISMKNNWKLYYMADLGTIFSSLKLSESITIGDFYDHEEKFIFGTTSFFAKPHFRLSYELYKIKVSLSGGYLIDFKAPFHLKDEKESKLLQLRGEDVKSSWNGFNAGLNVYFVL